MAASTRTGARPVPAKSCPPWMCTRASGSCPATRARYTVHGCRRPCDAASSRRLPLREDIMRIEVDLDLCDRQFVCAGLAPSVFGIGAVGELTVLQPEPAEALR